MAEGPGLFSQAVLAVDDIPDGLDLIEEFLEDEVWSVLRAESGDEAIRLAGAHHPDIILLDLMMPRMNGFAVIRTIKSLAELSDIDVIVQSAACSKDNVMIARRMGCDHLLCKPLSKGRLLEEIRDCARRRGRNEAPPRELPVEEFREMRMTLQDAKIITTAERGADRNELIEAGSFRELIPDTSLLGERLIRLANTPEYAGNRPVRHVAEAIVRIGTREIRALIRKASSPTVQGISVSRVNKALDLLDTLRTLFPDRMSTAEGTISLLEELNVAAQPQEPAATDSANPESPGNAANPGAARNEQD